jgi:hypothetical protein
MIEGEYKKRNARKMCRTVPVLPCQHVPSSVNPWLCQHLQIMSVRGHQICPPRAWGGRSDLVSAVDDTHDIITPDRLLLSIQRHSSGTLLMRLRIRWTHWADLIVVVKYLPGKQLIELVASVSLASSWAAAHWRIRAANAATRATESSLCLESLHSISFSRMLSTQHVLCHITTPLCLNPTPSTLDP